MGFVTNMRYGHNFSVVRNLLCDYCHCPLQAPCSEVHVILEINDEVRRLFSQQQKLHKLEADAQFTPKTYF